jgi:hypothetical protein
MNPELLALMIPIVAIVMGIGIGMLVVYLDFRRKSDTFKLYHAERMAAIEKGIELPPLPPEFFGTVARESNPVRNRRTGLVLLLLGLSVAGALLGMGIPAFWWGFVPAAIGLAFLLSSILEMRERKKASSAS